MGSSPSPPPIYTPPAPTPPDPFATAQAQQGYNVNSGIAQNLLNNTNQITPYGSINYNQTGGTYVGAQAAVPGTPATGGYWNGYSWVPTGGTPGTPAVAGQFVPQYTATTTLNPLVQSAVDQSLYNARGVGGLETNLIGQLQNAKYPAYANPNTYNNPNKLDLSWGNIAKNIYGLEKNTLDPMWATGQEQLDQKLANQGLTPGSQGWGYQQSQFGLNKDNAYNTAMLAAQGQGVADITGQYNAANDQYNTAYNALNNAYNTKYNAGVNQYNSQFNDLNSLRTGAQITEPGVGQTAQTANATIPAANYQGIATSNYATGSQALTAAEGLQQQAYNTQQQASNAMMGGLFGLGGDLIKGLGGLI